ncbi:DUF1963 domain-containing protein [Tropicibacter sp. R16_0]|uniref:DUF1963 domain-containing protein n=1 Tax=Tropicibacter sp. R16_0 TaxID=2821102 RepID=UPI001ADC685B|nr:DUF1963 domain-containing protein [Tropicibacter sp. R16_0]MBO9452850.1 DUF1963 domain-containing protein [Tropicibacter sp. R16_0]
MSIASVLKSHAALLIRPIPNSISTGLEPIRFGGRPRLPKGTDWPTRTCRFRDREWTVQDHFVAEIDFARLPKAVEGHSMPLMPGRGILSIFLPLDGDRIYTGETEVAVHFWPGDPADLSERAPPKDLPNMRDTGFDHVHDDGTMDDGRSLVPLRAEVLPFLSARAVNPLAVNMAAAEGADVSPRKKAHESHEDAVARAFAQAQAERPFPPPPELAIPEHMEILQAQLSRIPKEFRDFNWMLEAHHLDWAFIFDWSRVFFAGCLTIALSEHRVFLKSGDMSNLMRRTMERRVRKMTAQRKQTKTRSFGQGRKPWFRFFDKPAPVDMNFDYQARRWLNLSRFATGYPSEDMLACFADTLIELKRHYDETDDEGYNLGPRIWRLDASIDGHDAHAGNTLVAAKDAFKTACKNAEKRHKSRFDMMSQADRWDSRVIHESGQSAAPGFSLGTMPLQMFGQGFEIQSAVSDHVGDILLLQLGDSCGLPVGFGPDGIVQLWITPEDLANARFDNLRMTFEMT